MGVLLNLENISKSFSSKLLFKDFYLTISDGDKIGLIGENGTGKSTLTKIILGLEKPDTGNVSKRKLLKIGYVPQVASHPENASIWDIVSSNAKHDIHDINDNKDLKVSKALSLVGFEDFSLIFSTLSGGWKKRLDIACGIVNEPELLILDEPTNHLDFNGLIWLEKFLASCNLSWIMVTHDRYLLERSVNRIVEINKMYSNFNFNIEGKYHDFLEKRIIYIEQQQKLEATTANKVRREIEWLRRGPKARTTKARYRIDEANNLINELAELRSRMLEQHSSEIDFNFSERKTKQLIKIKNLSKSYDNKIILKDFNFNFTSGLRIGLLGGNGIGKSTLLKIISKSIEPDSGSIESAEKLKIVYFEQGRDSLNLQYTLKQLLADGHDTIQFKGRPIHIVSWIKKFNFTQEQVDARLSSMSGGEQARALIAKLMLEPADILLLDEPTNDLDIKTIEALEDNLLEFEGLLILVSHDRYMISKTCDLFIGFTGDGNVELFANYEQWLDSLKTSKKEAVNKKSNNTENDQNTKSPSKKLSYKEKLELTNLEQEIEETEKIIKNIEDELKNPKNSSNFVLLGDLTKELHVKQENLLKIYQRWEELSSK